MPTKHWIYAATVIAVALLILGLLFGFRIAGIATVVACCILGYLIIKKGTKKPGTTTTTIATSGTSTRPDHYDYLGNGILNSYFGWRWHRDAWLMLGVFGGISIVVFLIALVFANVLTSLGIGILAFAIFAGALWWPFVVEVPQVSTYFLLRFGRFAGFLLPGWRWVIPLMERIDEEGKVSFRAELWDLNEAEATRLGLKKIEGITKHGLAIPVNLAFRFRVSPLDTKLTDYQEQGAYQFVYGFKNNDELRQSLATIAQHGVRALAATMDWNDFLKAQSKITKKVKDGCTKMFKDYPGLDLYRVDVQEITIPASLVQAAETVEVAKKMAIVREREGKGEGDFVLKRSEGYRAARKVLLEAGVKEESVDAMLMSLAAYDKWAELSKKTGAVVIQPDISKLELNLWEPGKTSKPPESVTSGKED